MRLSTAIKFRLFRLREHWPPDFAHREDTDVIGAKINWPGHLAHEFLQLARPAEPQLARLDLRTLFAGVRSLLNKLLEKAARWLGVTSALKMREKLLSLGLHPGGQKFASS